MFLKGFTICLLKTSDHIITQYFP